MSATLENVYVDIPVEELQSIRKFFSLQGMRQAFLTKLSSYTLPNGKPKYTRRKLSYALDNGSCKTELLVELRAFIEDNKDFANEFIKDNEGPDKI